MVDATIASENNLVSSAKPLIFCVFFTIRPRLAYASISSSVLPLEEAKRPN